MALGNNRPLFTRGKLSDPAVFPTILDGNGKPLTLYGIFDDAFYDAQLGENRNETSFPRFTCQLSETTAIVRETPCTIKGKYFSVMEVQPDLANGLATIELAHDQPPEE